MVSYQADVGFRVFPHAKFKPCSINIEAFPPRQINILSKLQLATIKTCYLLSITSILSLVEMNLTNVILRLSYQSTVCKKYLKNLVCHFFLQPWLVLGVKLMEINSNWFSRYLFVFSQNLTKPLIQQTEHVARRRKKLIPAPSLLRRSRESEIYDKCVGHIYKFTALSTDISWRTLCMLRQSCANARRPACLESTGAFNNKRKRHKLAL